MSLIAKSDTAAAKSFLPCAEPVEVKLTRRPEDLTSATHWLTALAAQDDPPAAIVSCVETAAAGGDTRARQLAASAAATAVSLRNIDHSSRRSSRSSAFVPRQEPGDHEQQQHEPQ